MTVTRSIIKPGQSEGELAYWDATEMRWEGGGGLSGDDFVLKAGDTMTGILTINASGDAFFVAGGNALLDHLKKISTVTPTTGWVVTWNGTEYVPQAPASVPSTLESLTNVADPAPATNEVLTYTGSAWDGVSPSWLPTAGGNMTGNLNIYNGIKLRGFSNAGTTETFSIDATAGDAQFDGAVQANSGFNASGNSGVYSTGTSAFVVGDTTFLEAFRVNTSVREAQLRNGTKFRGFTDAGTTEKFSIDSATGNAQFDGNVQADTDITVGANTILTSALNFTIDDGGPVLSTGIKGDISVPFKGTIQSVRLLADVSGSIVIDLWKAAYASYPPTVANTITASAKPTLSAVIKNEDLVLTGWNKAVAAGDIIRVNVDSAATVTRCTIALTIKRVA